MEEGKPLQENNPEQDNKLHTTENNQQQEEILSSTEIVLPEIEQSEIPPSSGTEILETTNTENQNDMEVHHHAHNPAEPHHKKNWKAYFWEFLMLFLAVFCGFLAEYQLEHKIESDRGKQYTYSFYEDMITDSSHFNNLISSFQIKLSAFQNMAPCYDSLLSDHPPKNCLINLYLNSRSFQDMINTDRTLMQLKNADADSILSYDNLLRLYKVSESTGLQNVQTTLRETTASLRDYGVWKDSTNGSRLFAIYGNDKALLNKYFNQLTQYSNFCQARVNDLQKLKKRNTELIEYFKAKYHYE
jgi:hypothetical protein